MVIRILVVDDQTMVRESFSRVLAAQPGFEIAGDAGTVGQALELARRQSPDVALVDIELKEGENGLTLVRRLREAQASIRVLVVSAHNKPGYVRRAEEAGAHGYVLKDDGLAVLTTAIKLTVLGERKDSAGVDRFPVLLWDLLTRRQKEVAWLLAQGFTGPNINARLGIKVVHDHRAEIYRKLKVGSPLEIAAYIRKNGITECDQFADFPET